MLLVGSCSRSCAFSIPVRFGCKANAACETHTANTLFSKLISGSGEYFPDSYGEPPCHAEDIEFPFESPPAPSSPVSP